MKNPKRVRTTVWLDRKELRQLKKLIAPKSFSEWVRDEIQAKLAMHAAHERMRKGCG